MPFYCKYLPYIGHRDDVSHDLATILWERADEYNPSKRNNWDAWAATVCLSSLKRMAGVELGNNSVRKKTVYVGGLDPIVNVSRLPDSRDPSEVTPSEILSHVYRKSQKYSPEPIMCGSLNQWQCHAMMAVSRMYRKDPMVVARWVWGHTNLRNGIELTEYPKVLDIYRAMREPWGRYHVTQLLIKVSLQNISQGIK